MRAVPFAVACILLAASAAFAADSMAPNDIQATFFDGQSFTASTPAQHSIQNDLYAGRENDL